MNNEKAIEKEIQDKGLTAKRLTPADIDTVIEKEYYHRVPETAMTICVLTIRKGFMVTGESAAVSLENFDEEIGKKIAYENARSKVWAFEGYLLANS